MFSVTLLTAAKIGKKKKNGKGLYSPVNTCDSSKLL
jgi:hypothetical protein